MVYAHYRPIQYEPGAQSKAISSIFLRWIDAAAGRLPHTSPLWGILANRYFYIWKANEDQDRGQGDHGRLPHWWDDVQARPHFELGRANGTNDTGGGVSLTRRDARRRIWWSRSSYRVSNLWLFELSCPEDRIQGSSSWREFDERSHSTYRLYKQENRISCFGCRDVILYPLHAKCSPIVELFGKPYSVTWPFCGM